MWRSVYQYSCRVVRTVALLGGALALTGCASTISARVTSYQQWPGNTTGETYRIVATPQQQNNLEFQAFSDMVRAAIGPTGLVEAAPTGTPRFDIVLDYGNPVEQRWVQHYQDPYMDGWGFNPFFGGLYGGRGGWGSGIYISPSTRTVPVEVYKNTLTITIKDNQNDDIEVYRSSAVSIGNSDNLAGVMPYLAQAVFDGFPGNNGQVREVRYDRRN